MPIPGRTKKVKTGVKPDIAAPVTETVKPATPSVRARNNERPLV